MVQLESARARATNPRWGEYPADERSDAIVASMKLGELPTIAEETAMGGELRGDG